MLATTVVQQDDGKLVIGGAVLSGMRQDGFLARFDTAGAVDASFGVGGAAIYSSALAERVTALAQQTDGKLIAAVRADPGAMAVLRLTRDGALDPSFDGDGKALVEFAGIYSLATAVAVQSDGKIVIGADGDAGVGAVARLNPDGTPDSSFGSGGRMSFGVGFSAHGIGIVNGSLIIEPGGAILVGGDQWWWAEGWGGWYRDVPLDGFLARLTPSGALDPSFGQAGITIIDVGDGAFSSGDAMQGIARLPDGSLVAAMTTQPDARIAVVRLAAASNNPGRIGLLFSPNNAQEGSAALFTVRRTGGSAGVVSVDYSTGARPFVWPNVPWAYVAESGVDFTATAGTLTWPDGDVSYREINVPIALDTVVEPDEAFALTLSNPSVGASLATTESRMFIDDPAFGQPPPAPAGGGGAVGILDALMLVLLLLLSTANRPRRRSVRTRGSAVR